LKETEKDLPNEFEDKEVPISNETDKRSVKSRMSGKDGRLFKKSLPELQKKVFVRK
jgi:hypothetical protein